MKRHQGVVRYPERHEYLMSIFKTFMGFQDRKDPYHDTCSQLNLNLNEVMSGIEYGRLCNAVKTENNT